MRRPKGILLAALLLPALTSAQEGGDIQAQILYACHTEDTNTLQDLIQGLRNELKDDAANPPLRYHLAHAHYRLAELSGRAAARRADEALSDCIDDLKPLLRKDVKSVEALILQGACYWGLAELRTVQSVVLRARAWDRLNAAAKLAPRNPRLLLIESTQALARANPGSPEHQQALSQLNLAVQEFDRAPGTNVDEPGWGHAEAYLALGRELQEGGDRVQARNLIEKALIAAPDYKSAQRQLASLSNP
jgi:tetratricopeptide (TPR) repeat protein